MSIGIRAPAGTGGLDPLLGLGAGGGDAQLQQLADALNSKDPRRTEQALQQLKNLTPQQLMSVLGKLDPEILQMLIQAVAQGLGVGGAGGALPNVGAPAGGGMPGGGGGAPGGGGGAPGGRPTFGGGAPRGGAPAGGAPGGGAPAGRTPGGPAATTGPSTLDPTAAGGRGVQLAQALQRDLGLTPEQASGVVGNLMRESGLQSDIEERGGGGGYGLAQWTGSRRRDLEQFAAQRGKSPGDFDTQYQFLLHELRGSESRALSTLRQARTPEEAAFVFDRDFERSGVKAMGERTANARAVFEQLQGLA
jgi:hypothetical protein